MLRTLVVTLTLVLGVVAAWLAIGQPNTAFAQTARPEIEFLPDASHQTTIGPIATDNKPLESHTPYPTPPVDDPTPTTPLSDQLDLVFWLGFKALVGGAVVIGLVFMASTVYIQWKERRPRKRMRGEPRFQTRD